MQKEEIVKITIVVEDEEGNYKKTLTIPRAHKLMRDIFYYVDKSFNPFERTLLPPEIEKVALSFVPIPGEDTVWCIENLEELK